MRSRVPGGDLAAEHGEEGFFFFREYGAHINMHHQPGDDGEDRQPVYGLGDLLQGRRENRIEGHHNPAQHDADRSQDHHVHISFLPGVVGILGRQFFVLEKAQHLQGLDLEPFDVIPVQQHTVGGEGYEVFSEAEQDIEGQDEDPDQPKGVMEPDQVGSAAEDIAEKILPPDRG